MKAAQAKNDKTGEAQALTAIGKIYYDVSERRKALDYYSQALPIERLVKDHSSEVDTLDNLGKAYVALAEKQKALKFYDQALSVSRRFRDRSSEAKTLGDIGVVYADFGEKERALGYYDQALQITRHIHDRANEAKTLNRIGLVYSSLGDKEKALEYYNEALPIRREVGDRIGEAASLSNIGRVHSDLGEQEKALEYYGQALGIRREVGDRGGEASSLSNIGGVSSSVGERHKALEYYYQALSIRRQVGDRVGEAASLNNIGGAYLELGQGHEALEHYNQALSINREVGNLFGEADTLNGMGNVCYRFEEKQKALKFFNLVLPVKRSIGDRAGEASVLNNIGNIYSALGQKQKAIEYYSQALAIERQVGVRATEAMELSNMGRVYSEMGENQKALEYVSQALPISRQMSDRKTEAEELTNLGEAYSRLGEKQKAVEYYSQALLIAAFIENPRQQSEILFDLSRSNEHENPSLAILYGKLGVNLLQRLRGNISNVEEDLQKSYLASVSGRYRDLANLLIKQGRLPEAQQVLSLLKDQEYKDYVRGEANETLNPLSLTPAERSAEEDYQRSTAKAVEQGRRWSELKQDKARTPQEDKEFQQLSDSLGNASQLMNEYFARLYKLFSAGGDANRQVANITDETASLKQQIAKMPHTVALYTVVSEGRYSVIVISGATMVAREYVIPDKDLYQKVAAFRQIILDPAKDPKPLAQELYKILIGPIKADLDQAKAQTLIWSLDGVLRYVPFAALYDGQHYLVENYSLASFTPVSIAHILDKPNLSGVSAAAMGISAKFDDRLKPLPKVEAELDSIVQDPQVKGSTGVMPGTILLNGKFTELAMEKQLDGQRAVVHIASHFVLRPGDDSQSYLLLAGKDGDAAGYHMTVSSFRDNQKMSLEGTELLTLSACDTGVGGSSANGREVDGLATTAQRKGAKAVISSLWQLNDNSTADIMADFYKRWVEGGGKVMKAEALRQAQLDLLTGKVLAKPDTSNPNAGTSYAPPYYWAPFILMGNWQ